MALNYEKLTLESVLTRRQAIICYKFITGARDEDVNEFTKNALGKKKKRAYSIREMIELIKDYYGDVEFKNSL